MWIESHQSLRNHPKVKKAARLAGISEPEMIGRLHYLWWWALDYAPDGDLSKYSDDDIESAVDWHGEPGQFVKALIECGFNDHCGLIEKVKRGRVVHDWYEYGGKLIEKREMNAERMRAKRATHVQRTTGARTPTTEDKIREDNSTEEKSTEDNRRATHAQSPLPIQVQAFIDSGGKFPSGSLADGTSKRDNAIRVICETVKDDPESLELWRKVVNGYCAQWSSKSYTVMINDYYLKGRVPGQTSNGNGSNAHAATQRHIDPPLPQSALEAADRINARRHGTTVEYQREQRLQAASGASHA